MGTFTTPSTTCPSAQRATDVPTWGMRCTKLVVPSTGSMIQHRGDGSCPATQLSSARNSACGSSSPRRSLRKASTATSVSVTRSILPLCLTACVFSHWRRMMSPLSRTTSTTSCKNRAVSMKRYPKTGPLPGRGARQLRGQDARRPSRPETRPPFRHGTRHGRKDQGRRPSLS